GASGGAATTQDGTAGQGPAASGGSSRREEINRRLDETFGVFDETVRGTQEAIAKERAEQQGQGGGAPGEGEAGSETGGSGTGGDAADGSGPKRPGGLESVGRAGKSEGNGEGDGTAEGEKTASTQGGVGGTVGGGGGEGPKSVPADIPDGADDDIVARQIREAAMKETDPELRAALWDEYRRYKKGR
ncbi:MAG: hypothetical protein WBO00_11255, partial [Steroidobacteraceae bacterium]